MRKLVPLLALLLSVPAYAVTVTRLYTFEPGTKIQSSQLNGELDNIISALNGNLDGSTNITQLSVATGNIASAAVTKAKLGPLGQQISSSPPTASSNSANLANVANLTVNITVDHRPVFVGLQASGAGPGHVYYSHGGLGATGNTASVTFLRDIATINQVAIGARNLTNSSNQVFLSLPCSAFWFIDVPTAGPHNYTVAYQVATSDSGVISVENCKLAAYEL
jgi:hypothetical protein